MLDQEEVQQHKVDRKIAAEMDWLRHGVSGRRKRNQRRLGALHTLRQERREWRGATGAVAMTLTDTEMSAKLVIEAKNIAKSFGERPIVSDFSTRIARGDRVIGELVQRIMDSPLWVAADNCAIVITFDENEKDERQEGDQGCCGSHPAKAGNSGGGRIPTLVITNDQDFRVPVDQGLQLFTALRRNGVAANALVFENEGHWVLGALDSRRWHERVFAWMKKYLAS